jgi:hypothetical protein
LWRREKKGLSAGISGKQLTTEDSVCQDFWLHSAVDAQRVDGDPGLAWV